MNGKQPLTLSGKYKYSMLSKPATLQAQQWEGWKAGKQALKPAHEPIVLAQKAVEGNYVNNVLKWSCGGINVDGCRIEAKDGGWSWGTQTDIRSGGYASKRPSTGNIYNTNIRGGQNGRFPPNLIIDEFVAELLDEQSGELKSGFMKAGHPYGLGNGQNVYGKLTGETKRDTYGDSGGASRFFKVVKPFCYVPKADSKERNAGLGNVENEINDMPSLKPINLMRWLVRLVTPPSGVVLDPFAGSGTTGVACVIEGFNYLLIEKQEKFANTIIPKRIDFWSNPKNWEKLKEHKELAQRNNENRLNQKRLCEF